MLKTAMTRSAIIAFACSLSLSAHAVADGGKRAIHIPSGELATALELLARQSGADLVYRPEHVEGFRTSGVDGELSAEEAVTKLLNGTPLILSTDSTGAMLIALPTAETPAPVSGERRGEGEGATSTTVEETVVVTGTHIRGEQAAGSKVIVFNQQAIERSGHGRLQDVMATLSQNFNGVNENYQSELNNNRGAEVQLRGLGAGTTLTLVNGQRQAMGGQQGSFVNISSLPVSAIERIEVLPEGASAIYGSDAIGGVVNIILRKDYSGLESRVRVGTAGGEAREKQAAQLFGAQWSKARVLVGYDYYERDSLPANSRAYSASNDDLRAFGGRDFRVVGGNPGTLLTSGTSCVGAALNCYAIPSGQDGSNLTLGQLTPGTYNYTDNVTHADVLPAIRTHAAFVSSSFDLSETWKLFVDGRYGDRDNEVRRPLPTLSLVVPASNAFNSIGSQVRVLYNFSDDLGPALQVGATDTYFANVGAAGRLAGEWQLKVSGSYAQERNTFENSATRPTAAFSPYLASTDPVTALNLFGDAANADAAFLDALRLNTAYQRMSWTTKAANATANGPLFHLPAGAVKLAVGSDHREEHRIAHSITRTLNIESYSNVRRNVTAVFGELAVPLLGPGGGVSRNRLEASLAGRYEDYSDFGTSFDPKIGLSWQPWSFIKFRGTWGTSFRAPPFHLSGEHFNTMSASAIPNVVDPRSPTQRSQVIVLSGNSPDLDPETADVWTAGIDFEPSFAPGLGVSLTYFDVAYTDKIGNAGPYQNMLAEEPLWTEAIIRDPTQAQIDAFCNGTNFSGSCVGPFAAILDTRTRNLAGVFVSGIDAEIDYALPFDVGQWNLGLRGTYTFDYETQLTSTAPLFDLVDTLERPLALRASAFASWSFSGWTAQATILHAGAYENTADLPVSKIDSWTTLDLNVGYRFAAEAGWLSGTRLTLGAVNVLDKEPPFVNRGNSFGYDPANGHLLGRQVSLLAVKSW